ncbi:hypothetical protein DL93DRAFT_2102510 [Clavulina sp. PMI_390]|nr:hypothetical protein DL93DRAFT_2102510 [Clavulina sp. PMI_390]
MVERGSLCDLTKLEQPVGSGGEHRPPHGMAYYLLAKSFDHARFDSLSGALYIDIVSFIWTERWERKGKEGDQTSKPLTSRDKKIKHPNHENSKRGVLGGGVKKRRSERDEEQNGYIGRRKQDDDSKCKGEDGDGAG